MKIVGLFMLSVIAATASGCVSAEEHRAAVANPTNDKLTLGTVQKDIKIGMSSTEVASVLGSPNMVTTDERRREAWVYDKIATDIVVSSSGFSLSGLGGVISPVGVAGIGAGAGGGYNRNAGAASTSQRTLTIIIKFDEAQKVRDYSYRSSSF